MDEISGQGMWPKTEGAIRLPWISKPLVIHLKAMGIFIFIHTLLYPILFFNAGAYCLSCHSVIPDLDNLDFTVGSAEPSARYLGSDNCQTVLGLRLVWMS